MPFGKKNDQATGVEAPGDETLEAAFPPAEDDVEDELALSALDLGATDEGEPAGEAAAPDAAPDALLSMFQTTEATADDRSALLDLAGVVEMDDLLEELHTLAAALGVARPAVA
jgi:hypothetical protein